MKRLIYIFIACASVLLQSCVSDLTHLFSDEDRLTMNLSIVGFEPETRAGESAFQIPSGAVMYLDFDGFKTSATYNGTNGSWRLADCPPTSKTSGSVKVYYPSDLSWESCPMQGTGSFTNTVSGTTVSATIRPLTARVRFIGGSNVNATVSGLQWYSGFNTSTYTFESTSGPIALHYTPATGSSIFAYALFAGDYKLDISVDGRDFTKSYSSNILQPGRSGYITLGNGVSYDGWVDMTSYITNPDFDGDDVITGWSGTQFGQAGPIENAEHYNNNFDTYQTITGLTPGRYRVSVQGYYRCGLSYEDYSKYTGGNYEAYQHAKLYASSAVDENETGLMSISTGALSYSLGGSTSSVGEGLYIPNNMEAAHYWFEAGYYADNYVECMVGEDGELTIGVRKFTTVEGDWVCIDSWKLEYFPEDDGTPSFNVDIHAHWNLQNMGQHWLIQDVKTGWYLNENGTRHDACLWSEGEWDTGSHWIIMDVSGNMVSNVVPGNKYYLVNERLEEAGGYVYVKDDYTLGCTGASTGVASKIVFTEDDRGDYYISFGAKVFMQQDILSSSLQLSEDFSSYIRNRFFNVDGSEDPYEEPTPVTNHNFYEWDGWGLQLNSAGSNPGNLGEVWYGGDFERYQDLSGLPEGNYLLSCDGFYRAGGVAQDSYDRLLNDDSEVYAFVFASSSIERVEAQLPNLAVARITISDLYERLGGSWYFQLYKANDEELWLPSTLKTADICIKNGLYKNNRVPVRVGSDGQLRVGVGKLGRYPSDWLVVDNFSLFYLGK